MFIRYMFGVWVTLCLVISFSLCAHDYAQLQQDCLTLEQRLATALVTLQDDARSISVVESNDLITDIISCMDRIKGASYEFSNVDKQTKLAMIPFLKQEQSKFDNLLGKMALVLYAIDHKPRWQLAKWQKIALGITGSIILIGGVLYIVSHS